jgi:DNA helicase-2/ATP-dependent DNA helicase PcrA
MIASLLAGEGTRPGTRTLSNEDRAMGLTEEDLPRGKARGPNICVVGDPDQSIYGWRGADITNILEFEEHYPGARVITLGENFRSTKHILGAADTLIQKNQRRKHKPLFTSKEGGELVEATLCREERHEAGLVTDWFKSLHDEGGEEGDSGFPWREMAVFYRTNSLSRVLEESFRQANIPYTIARGTAFYDREEVKNALSYLRVIANGADGVSLERIVNTPTRGIGDAAMVILQREAGLSGTPLLSAMRRVRDFPNISSRAAGGVQKFTGMLDEWTGGGTFLGASVPGSLADLVDRVIQESGLRAMYQNQARASGNETDLERVDNLDELVSSAREFEQEYDSEADPAIEPTRATDGSDRAAPPPLLSLLRGFLESVSLVADADSVDPAQGSVTLMTLHAAKGLEFKAAAIVGLEEGTLPHSRALGGDADQMEEERRLCFVGITRAMRRLHLSCAKYRTIRGLPERTIPSRFLSEVPKEHVRFSDQSEAMADLKGTTWGDELEGTEADSPRFVPDEGVSGTSAAGVPRGGVTPPSMGTKIAQALPPGSVVRHPQFGEGKVLSVTGGMNARAVIRFKDVGEKTMILEHARLTRVR